jgi:hypothetical protein
VMRPGLVLWFRYEVCPQKALYCRLGPQLVALLRGDWVMKVLMS